MANENNTTTKPYIVKNADGVEYLLPYYPATFRALLDDKDTIRDLLNSILELDNDHEIVDLSYAFENMSTCLCLAMSPCGLMCGWRRVTTAS